MWKIQLHTKSTTNTYGLVGDVKTLVSEALVMGVDECLAFFLPIQNDTLIPQLLGGFAYTADLFAASFTALALTRTFL